MNKLIMTTSIDVPTHTTTEILGIVVAETAIAMNLFKDIGNMFRDLIGGRSNTVQNTLKEARQTCLDQLQQDAQALGADAVIAVDLKYSQSSSGKSGGILIVAATGTAVRLSPL